MCCYGCHREVLVRSVQELLWANHGGRRTKRSRTDKENRGVHDAFASMLDADKGRAQDVCIRDGPAVACQVLSFFAARSLTHPTPIATPPNFLTTTAQPPPYHRARTEQTSRRRTTRLDTASPHISHRCRHPSLVGLLRSRAKTTTPQDSLRSLCLADTTTPPPILPNHSTRQTPRKGVQGPPSPTTDHARSFDWNCRKTPSGAGVEWGRSEEEPHLAIYSRARAPSRRERAEPSPAFISACWLRY